MLPSLGPCLPRRRFCHHSLDTVIMWTAWAICIICPPDVVNSFFQNIDHRILCWPCCWARCWILQDMDHMEASFIFNVKVGWFDQLLQSKICVLTFTSLGIVILTAHHDLMVSMWFIQDLGNLLRQTLPYVLFVEECLLYQSNMRFQLSFTMMYPCKQIINIGPTYYKSRDHSNPLQLYAAGFNLNRTCKLAVTHSILTCT